MRSSRSSCSVWNFAARRSLRVVTSARVNGSTCRAATGVAHVAPYGGVAPPLTAPMEAQVHLDELSRRRRRGSDSATRKALVGHAGADHLVVAELHALDGDLPGGRLADHAAGPRAAAPRRLRSSRRRRRCGAARPCADAPSCSSSSAASLGQERRRASWSSGRARPFVGCAPISSFESLLTDALGRDDLRRSRISTIAARRRGAGSTSSWETNRAARSMRRGSSPNDSCGSSGVSRNLAARWRTPPCGSTRSPSEVAPPSR